MWQNSIKCCSAWEPIHWIFWPINNFHPNLPLDRDDTQTLPTLFLPRTWRRHDVAECSRFFLSWCSQPPPDTGWSELSFLSLSRRWLSESDCLLQPTIEWTETDIIIVLLSNRFHDHQTVCKMSTSNSKSEKGAWLLAIVHTGRYSLFTFN